MAKNSTKTLTRRRLDRLVRLRRLRARLRKCCTPEIIAHYEKEKEWN